MSLVDNVVAKQPNAELPLGTIKLCRLHHQSRRLVESPHNFTDNFLQSLYTVHSSTTIGETRSASIKMPSDGVLKRQKKKSIASVEP